MKMKLFTSSIIFLYLFALTSDQVVDWWPVRQFIDTIKPTGDEEYTKKQIVIYFIFANLI